MNYRGEIVAKSGYHPEKSGCDCDSKGYRDVETEDGDVKRIYYHSTEIVTIHPDKIVLRTGGWETSSTKERLNWYLPRGYRVSQRDGTWYLDRPDGSSEPFRSGMEVPR